MANGDATFEIPLSVPLRLREVNDKGAPAARLEPPMAATLADKPAPARPEWGWLQNQDGTPTRDGWHKIGALLRKEMPRKTRKGRGGLTFDYINARQVMERLDTVLGPGNWSTRFRVLDLTATAVECTLTLFGVSKSDVGYANNPENPEDEALKSAYSDSFKRAAVHFGVGRFLYEDKAS